MPLSRRVAKPSIGVVVLGILVLGSVVLWALARRGGQPRSAEAIPSGTLPIAPGTPATASRPSVWRLGRTDVSQSPRRPGAQGLLSEHVDGPCDHASVPPWHCFHLRPEPQVQGSLRPRLASSVA